jgi:hypothetical protein
MPSTDDYRVWVDSQGLHSYIVSLGESDLYIATTTDLSAKASVILRRQRALIEDYIRANPGFSSSLEPLPCPEDAPPIIRNMCLAAQAAGVGPMAAVAGAVADYIGRELGRFSTEVIVENGGDIYLHGKGNRTIAIYAGNSPLSGKVGVEIDLGGGAAGVCTSSGTVGHSLSFGKADAAVALASSATLADAAATALGNRVKNSGDIEAGLALAAAITGISGAVIIVGDHIGAWGAVKLIRLACPQESA